MSEFVFDEQPVPQRKRNHRRGNSGLDSLAYSSNSSVQSVSTTGESSSSSLSAIRKVYNDNVDEDAFLNKQLISDDLPQTITGQPSNSHEHDGGSRVSMAIFERANPVSPKKNSNRKSPVSVASGVSKDKSRRSSNHNHSPSSYDTNSSSKSKRNNTATTPPPRMPLQKSPGKELWYNQFWMCGFADALNWDSK